MPPSAPASVVLEEPHYQQSDLLELQKQVDLGHQPWRLEPDQVAIVFLKKYIKETVRSEPIVKRNTEQEVEVEVSTDKEKFSVALRRFREKYGIWYVTRILRE